MRKRPMFKFRLFVADDTQNSAQALVNLRAICRTHLAARHEIEVISVFRDPQRAVAEDIRMTPTLLILAPTPVRRIVGNLSQTQRVLELLDLTPPNT
jgi:circadian clock protein KaiB